MKYLMAPIWLASFLEKENASRISRETRCLSVLLNRSIIGSVLKVGSVPLSGTVPFWTHKSLCFETYPAVKMGLYPLQGHYLKVEMLT